MSIRIIILKLISDSWNLIIDPWVPRVLDVLGFWEDSVLPVSSLGGTGEAGEELSPFLFVVKRGVDFIVPLVIGLVGSEWCLVLNAGVNVVEFSGLVPKNNIVCTR